MIPKVKIDKLVLSNLVAQKIKYYINAVNAEISGMAKSVIDEETGNIIVTDCVIFEQEVTGTTTDLNERSMALFLAELQRTNQNTMEWNIWWHSHANMGVFWSTTDENTIQEHQNQPFLISLVVNKANQMLARLDLWPNDRSPFSIKTTYRKDLTVVVDTPDNEAIKKKCLKEVEAKVKQKTYQYQFNKQGSFWNSNKILNQGEHSIPKKMRKELRKAGLTECVYAGQNHILKDGVWVTAWMASKLDKPTSSIDKSPTKFLERKNPLIDYTGDDDLDYTGKELGKKADTPLYYDERAKRFIPKNKEEEEICDELGIPYKEEGDFNRGGWEE